MRKLQMELQAKGVERSIIDEVIQGSERHDTEELLKVIAKKAGRYDDQKKLIAYLVRQGFRYDDVHSALNEDA